MQIRDNLKNFLYDQEYYIDLYQDYIHLYDYEKLVSLTSTSIEIKFKSFLLKVKGQNLRIKNMDKKEMLIKGLIEEMRLYR